jgi:methyltransferase family protein
MSRSTEDNWTPPSSWCPEPKWWHSSPDSPDETEYEVTDLVAAFVTALQPEVVVETGTSTGRTAAAIGRELVRNGHGRLWTVEIDEGQAEAARVVVSSMPVTVVCADSLGWTPPDRINFAWIDSGTAQVRVQEIRQWQDRFCSGAVIGIHDTAPNMGREATSAALAVLFRETGWSSMTLRTPRGVTFVQVP